MKTNNQNPQTPNKKGADNRSDTRKHQYKEHDAVLTNDQNYLCVLQRDNFERGG